MYLKLTKTVGKRPNLQKGTIHDWSRRVISAYAEQWGPKEEWMVFISEEEAEVLETSTPSPVESKVPDLDGPKDKKKKPRAKAKVAA